MYFLGKYFRKIVSNNLLIFLYLFLFKAIITMIRLFKMYENYGTLAPCAATMGDESIKFPIAKATRYLKSIACRYLQ